MFNLKGFIKKGLLDAVGKQADYWVILNAAGWLEKSVLDETDLEEINAAIDAKNTAPEVEAEEENIAAEPEANEQEETAVDEAEETAAESEEE